nr:MAG TPA: hypothetical protein [Caudoviricetes sp.]
MAIRIVFGDIATSLCTSVGRLLSCLTHKIGNLK